MNALAAKMFAAAVVLVAAIFDSVFPVKADLPLSYDRALEWGARHIGHLSVFIGYVDDFGEYQTAVFRGMNSTPGKTVVEIHELGQNLLESALADFASTNIPGLDIENTLFHIEVRRNAFWERTPWMQMNSFISGVRFHQTANGGWQSVFPLNVQFVPQREQYLLHEGSSLTRLRVGEIVNGSYVLRYDSALELPVGTYASLYTGRYTNTYMVRASLTWDKGNSSSTFIEMWDEHGYHTFGGDGVESEPAMQLVPGGVRISGLPGSTLEIQSSPEASFHPAGTRLVTDAAGQPIRVMLTGAPASVPVASLYEGAAGFYRLVRYSPEPRP